MRKLDRKTARSLTSAMDEVATTIQKAFDTLGIPEKIASDYAYRTDMLSDAIEEKATKNFPLRKRSDFDAEEIGEVVDGPLESIDGDEVYMDDHFTGIESEEISKLSSLLKETEQTKRKILRQMEMLKSATKPNRAQRRAAARKRRRS